MKIRLMHDLDIAPLQGTLYPDVIESCPPPGSGQKHSHTIKSHHNVGGLPKDLDFTLIEPLRELFKVSVCVACSLHYTAHHSNGASSLTAAAAAAASLSCCCLQQSSGFVDVVLSLAPGCRLRRLPL